MKAAKDILEKRAAIFSSRPKMHYFVRNKISPNTPSSTFQYNTRNAQYRITMLTLAKRTGLSMVKQRAGVLPEK